MPMVSLDITESNKGKTVILHNSEVTTSETGKIISKPYSSTSTKILQMLHALISGETNGMHFSKFLAANFL